ncbi:DNA-3-methyladenine glycosylase I [Fructobacillus tropaeoli]|uniref:DNA-3-methyladenine glycosylase I n=1 Tax=Fructobacillus tropaeoli TaxID=709323 RepID=UPI001455F549|nr:DNA-3-methyladenine glycosylase I [Fructobacillus tropaeoli]NLS38211.1 DNA-3-methyladenine glycosylase I [Fructobacillus tropaeoli]
MVTRCRWATNYEEGTPMVAYHDHEFGHPVRDDERLLFELLTLELFQSGLSWRTVLNKRANFKAAFADFDINQVAHFDQQDVEQLLSDAGIIRNRMKIEATINNAQQIQTLHHQGETFSDLIWQQTNGQTLDIGVDQDEKIASQNTLSEAFSKQLKKIGFKFVGPVTVESFLQAVGVENAHDLECDFR